MMGGWLGGAGCCGFGTYGAVGLILNLVITVGALVGIVLLIVWAVRRLKPGASLRSGDERRSGEENSARAILKLRYASGEITREQFQQILTDLA
jgi:uncharacterized membrane protein